MNLYRQSIALFGLVLPIVIAVLVIGGAFFAKAKVTRSFDDKASQFKGYKQNKIAAQTLEAEISQKRGDIDRWKELIDRETASSISQNLREIEEQLPSKEFQKTAQGYPTARAGFATVSAQNSAQVRLAFRATFRSMQQALLQLETRMPQLQLQDLRIEPSSNSNSLNFEVNYTAWEK